MVAEMTDIFVLLLAPAGGDELQGVKRGIMEIADLVVINKADGALKAVAEATCAEYAAALRLFRHRRRDPEGFPAAVTASAIEGSGLDEVWHRVRRLEAWRRGTGWFAENRQAQAVRWLRRALERGAVEALYAHPAVARRLPEAERLVAAGGRAPEEAADELLRLFRGAGDA
jgi:LAO/AO transport system kinase